MRAGLRSKATLQSVALTLGVHPSTVSRALNPTTRHMVASDLGDRIRAVAAEQGFRVDAIASSLRTRRSRIVGIVLPDIANPVFGPILSGIEAILAGHGYSALVVNAESEDRQAAAVEDLMARRVDGLVLATVRSSDRVLTRCLDAGVPTVLVNRAEETLRASAVVSDDLAGMALAVEHLVALGHRTIAHLGGPPRLSTGTLRREGFERAMLNADLAPGRVIAATAYTRDAGREAGRLLLDTPGLTAIATANDLLAIGLYDEIRARGLRCPDDLSVTGHNDMPLVDMIDPPLTTIRIQQDALGRLAGELVLHHIADRSAAVVRRIMAPTLVVRLSTARPPASPEGRDGR